MTSILFDEALSRYATQMSSDELPALTALERETYLKEMQPVMLSGHLQGSFLRMLCSILRPSKVLEIGTFTGYSAICMAMGLSADAVLHTIEIDEERKEIAQKHFEAAGMQDRIVPHYGDAKLILKTLKEPWDLVFIDADKPNYTHYFDLVFEELKIGGIILADNVLFEGKILLPEEEQGKNERAMHQFNKKIKLDKRLEVLLLPIRDGISIIRKIAK
ncbi:MAG: O-methyltransferase [Phycisphaerales bacterium]|nr:O-methyltransferase [Phycisphaerales bacterium]